MAVIETTGLTKFYGKARGIEDVTLSIDEGEIFGFIGPNGAGKSTTIRLLLNLIFPTGGTARIFGLDIIKDTKRIKQSIGYVPAEATAYSAMTVGDFLDYSGRFYSSSGIKERKVKLAELLELDLKRKVADLSTGNRRKVAIVQSLIHSPKLLILDEPTSGLDPLMQSRFFDLIREENKNGVTIFYSSHVLSEIQKLCGRVAIIREGKIIKQEEIETLRRNQLRRVKVVFSVNKAQNLARAEGISGYETEDDITARFMFSGSIDELLNLLAGQEISDLTIEEPALEEIFLHYYNQNSARK
jgi:ABC-2 type transport system ATP-binding protein